MKGKLSAEMVETAYQRTAAMREAGGKDLDIIIELHAYVQLTGNALGFAAISLGQRNTHRENA